MLDVAMQTKVATIPITPRIIPRSGHIISRANIDERALKVLYRLNNAGFQAFLVGGSVRDLLLGREPKDFDVATDALPEQVRELFRNCRLIGRRFRLAHVHFGRDIIEVATFRGADAAEEDGRVLTEDGRILRDNVYGNIDNDAWRRDFTVNALYYNIEDFSVVDYVGGMDDIKAGQIRIVGNTQQRFREDPVRMLRAVRFAVKLGFSIHPQTATPIFELAPLLSEIPPARLFEEILKLFLGGCAVQTFAQLRHYGLFGQLFPQVEACLSEEEGGFPHMFLARALQNTDRRIAEGKPVTPAFLISALLWDPMRRLADEHRAHELSPAEADQLASDTVISQQISRIAMPRRYTQMTREIWALQPRLTRRVGGTPFRLLSHPRFRAAYDFLLLRAEAGEEVTELAEWWTEFQGAKEIRRDELISAASKTAPAKRRRRRR
ncbi:MAG: polynucleotide adenylyltransferase PcnB [Gammaproteobacteria bacterium]